MTFIGIVPSMILEAVDAMQDRMHAEAIEGRLEGNYIETSFVHLFDDGTEKHGPALQRSFRM